MEERKPMGILLWQNGRYDAQGIARLLRDSGMSEQNVKRKLKFLGLKDPKPNQAATTVESTACKQA